MNQYVIGVDFGSDSVRSAVIDAIDGKEIGEGTSEYKRWKIGLYQDAQSLMFRHHPLDYIEALSYSINTALDSCSEKISNIRSEIKAIGIDTTGSTPCPVDEQGVPLALHEEFKDDPDAMFHLWKDHTAIKEALEITSVLKNNCDSIDYTKYMGAYASEWFWAKILHTSRKNSRIAEKAYSWVELCDWIPSMLVGRTNPNIIYRCSCAAGHKAYWHSSWNGLPSFDCISSIDPILMKIYSSYKSEPQSSVVKLGTLNLEWAQKLGLSEKVIVSGSSFDAHAGAVGAGVSEEKMVLNLGTSAVNMFVTRGDSFSEKNLSWLAGSAENSIIPGMNGIETAQAAFGDVYAWLKKIVLEPVYSIVNETFETNQAISIKERLEDSFFQKLQEEAQRVPLETLPIALDWFNGRRYPSINETVKSAIIDLSMGTDAATLYRALVVATVMGQKRIIDLLEREGITIGSIIAVGGIAQKSPFVMQTLSDALDKEIHVSVAKQACARGAAMFASVAAGIHGSLPEAQKAMNAGTLCTYYPNKEKKEKYEMIYKKYVELSFYVDPDTMH